MAFLAFLPILGQLIDRVFPDPTVAANAKLELAKLEASGELQQILGQLAINQAEAQNTNLFVSGWRPFIGWVCGCSLAYTYIASPFLSALLEAFGHPVTLPVLSVSDLIGILTALLGLGTLRSFEKVKGVA